MLRRREAGMTRRARTLEDGLVGEGSHNYPAPSYQGLVGQLQC